MLFLYKTKLNHFIFVEKTLHNLTLKNFTSEIKNPILTQKKYEKNDKNIINTNKMNNNPTAINVSSHSDDNRSNNSIADVYCDYRKPTTSSSKSKKESNINNNLKNLNLKDTVYVKKDACFYRHTRYYSPKHKNNSLPNSTSSLQNYYLRRDASEAPGIKRHFSTSDVHQKKQDDTSAVENMTMSFRKWEPTAIGRNLINAETIHQNGQVFKVLNYNVLSQDLLIEHPYIYKQHHPRALLWEIRWRNLYNEITSHNADIICLQEVQSTHIEHYYENIKRLGYGQLFKRKIGDRSNREARSDGCAIYYRKEMFKLVDYINVEFFQSDTTILDRENVAIVAMFAPHDKPDEYFVVATTHLLYNPKRQDVRLAQTQVLLTEIERMAFKLINNAGLPEYYPIIMTGDFNSEPLSKVVQFILEGQLKYDILAKRSLNMFDMSEKQLRNSNYSQAITGKELIPPRLGITDYCQHLDILPTRKYGLKPFPRSKQEQLIHLENTERSYYPLQSSLNPGIFSTGTLHHNFNLKDAYFELNPNRTGTTFQKSWITVDYIFYSTEHVTKQDGSLKLLWKYTVPTVKQLQRVRTIPNYVFGSDHIALLATFKLEYDYGKPK